MSLECCNEISKNCETIEVAGADHNSILNTENLNSFMKVVSQTKDDNTDLK